ncbi:ABC transporter ATP-binding protein [Microbacterium sp. ET2]|uniref:ABC transporter ATP-binding protein n=1 Tax=Microbacterium albipurpureum TaxID=3050384 RepID=UPI00259CD176|nr:ABC transporter ATP-binding protein [Microbacterium sp. ET2 (Ac-2212)]WJL96698.1 ABC transporter ATP-binding protein [Microbacterium sp. ET2 (Ac-2212)]
MTASLTLDTVSKRFRGARTAAVSGVTLHVAAGSCTAVLGPSGSGKSTLLRLVAGLEAPDSGRVLIGGHDVAGVAAERRGVGMVFQKSLLFPHLSVLDNVAFSARVRGESRRRARARAAEFLEMVQLRGFGARRVDELSGGQEQRVAIARALAAEPAVLLLDEPFSALDPALRADMHALLDELRLTVGPTILLVTHDRDEASRVADRIAVLDGGELHHESDVAGAYRAPSSVRVAELMGARNLVPGVMADGVHTSDLGEIPIPDAAVSGPAVLIVRQEDVQVWRPAETPPSRHPLGTLPDADRSADDAGRAPLAVETALSVRVTAVRWTGTVESARASGARTDLTVRVTPTVLLHAEVTAAGAPRLGERVALSIPAGAAHVVPA